MRAYQWGVENGGQDNKKPIAKTARHFSKPVSVSGALVAVSAIVRVLIPFPPRYSYIAMYTRTQTYYGVSLGILMVKSSFRRYLGDIGNALTWPFPVQYRIVTEALPSNITQLHKTSLLEPFKRAADELIAGGVAGITTTCGFLSIYQRELAAHCSVPVATSSLLQIPSIQHLLPPGKRVGILTYNGEALGGPYLEAVGVAADTPVVGMPPDSAFVRWISQGDNRIPYAVLRDEVLAAARRLRDQHPEVGAIVCECTNMPPFASAIHAALQLPVFDVVTLVKWFQASLCPPCYEPTSGV